MKYLRQVRFIAPLFFLLVISVFASAQEPTETTQTARERGVQLYNQKNFNEAIKYLRAVVKNNKSDSEAFNYLGLALSRSGNDKDAKKAFEQAVKANPNNIESRINLTMVLINLNKLKDAEKEAKKIIAIDSNNPEPHYLMALIYLRNAGNSRNALDSAEDALKIDPKFAKAFYTKSQAYINLFSENYGSDETVRYKYLDQAADALEEYLRLVPNNADSQMLRERTAALRFYSRRKGASNTNATDDENEVYSSQQVTTKAIITFKQQPEYTEKARMNGVSGVIRVMVVLAADGKVKHILVVNGLPEGLTEKAVEAAKGIRFQPATKDGKPVSQVVTLEYSFRIY